MIFFIPGWVISFMTFPGVVLHEIAHRFFCDLFGIPVYEICYFQIGKKRAGHVRHEGTPYVAQNLFIALAPFLVNSLACCLLMFPVMAQLYLLEGNMLFFEHELFHMSYLILAWLGFSAGVNAFPSNQDMSVIAHFAREHRNIIIGLFLGILVIIVRVLNFLDRFFLSFFYAYGISKLFAETLIG